MITLGNWQEFPYGGGGDHRDLLRDARTKASIIPYLRLGIRCPRIQRKMFKVVGPGYLRTNDSLSSVPFNYLGTIKSCHVVCLAGLFQSQRFFCKMMKDKENSSKIFLLDSIFSIDHTCTWLELNTLFYLTMESHLLGWVNDLLTTKIVICLFPKFGVNQLLWCLHFKVIFL